MTREQLRLEKFIVYFTLVYTIIFSTLSFINSNIEFIYYTCIIILTLAAILFIHKRLKFYPIVLTGLSFIGLFHMMGGNIRIGDTRLYDFYFIPELFKYDNFMHLLGSAIMVMVAYALLQPVIADDFKGQRRVYFGMLLALIGMGLGTINEMIEFIGVLLFDVGEQVGGYNNTLLDLVYNTIGSAIMAYVLVRTNAPLVEIYEPSTE